MSASSRPLDSDQLAAVELLRSARRFVLCGHMRPDGDCIGAQAALARVLESRGKDVWVINPDPPEGRFAYLSREVTYRAWTGGELPVHDVAVMLDFCEPQRLGALEAPLFAAGSKKLVVDHHVHAGTAFWDAAFVDVRAAATGLLVRRIARALDAPLDRVAAEGVFTSIVTDTGWFKYSNTDAETLAVAAEMVELGVEPNRLYDALYQQRSREHPVHVGRLLARTDYLADARLAVVAWPQAEVVESDLVDTDEVLDILRSVRSVEVVIFLRELKTGHVKASVRSKTEFDAQALCRQFGGGGHRKAAGATIAGNLDTVRPRVQAAALEVLGALGALGLGAPSAAGRGG
ncbi:MAG: bifunctional oligoribonuclease/PAP phosphatase NrnA [Planctomycetes bacterium]|nr:bifunctional oligoribonuclease/PAP phosphatase NrnA [Planctomycetota bacterium]